MNTALQQMAFLSPCPDKLIKALAENLMFNSNYELACKEVGIINDDNFSIGDDGSCFYSADPCDCEFSECEHTKYAQEKQDELNDKFQELCLRTCEFHHQELERLFSDDNGDLLPGAVEKYIEEYL